MKRKLMVYILTTTREQSHVDSKWAMVVLTKYYYQAVKIYVILYFPKRMSVVQRKRYYKGMFTFKIYHCFKLEPKLYCIRFSLKQKMMLTKNVSIIKHD